MHYVELSDAAFKIVVEAAAHSGQTVSEYLEQLITEEDMSHLFTPERMQIIVAAREEATHGKVVSLEQFETDLQKVQSEWIKSHR